MKYIDIRDLKEYNDDFICINGQNIKLLLQRTGFGYKKFFQCPLCEKRREKLYKKNQVFICRSCIDINIYKTRTNLYDEKSENLIQYYIKKYITELGIDFYEKDKFGWREVSYSNFLSVALSRGKPKYMREAKYEYLMKSLFLLDWMYWQSLSGKTNYTARDIKDMLHKENVEFVYEHFLFPQYFDIPEEFKHLNLDVLT